MSLEAQKQKKKVSQEEKVVQEQRDRKSERTSLARIALTKKIVVRSSHCKINWSYKLKSAYALFYNF